MENTKNKSDEGSLPGGILTLVSLRHQSIFATRLAKSPSKGRRKDQNRIVFG